MKIAKAIDFPPGFGIELGGASRDQEELFAEMFTALIMGIFVMYLVLVMQFGSFTAPLPVMMSLPLSLIGVVLALLLTRGTLNLMSFIGVIMLMGLVAKNAILLLDCARKEEEQGIDREEALMHAGRVRLRPILMTTFALIAGMLPVAIGVGEGGEFYSSDGGGHHRRHHHLDAAHAAGDPELLRQHRDQSRTCQAQVSGTRGVAESRRCLPGDDRRRLPHRDARSVSSIALSRWLFNLSPCRASGGARRAARGQFRRAGGLGPASRAVAAAARRGQARRRSALRGGESGSVRGASSLRGQLLAHGSPGREFARSRFSFSVRDLQPLRRGHADLAGARALRASQQRRQRASGSIVIG